MKILLIDKGGYFLDFALRCVDAGHDVRWFLGKLKGGDRSLVGDGFGIQKVVDWSSSMKWADIIILPDNSVYMEELEPWRRRGFPIFGPNLEMTKWEMNRQVGMDILKEAGCEIIQSHTFKKISDAKAFLAKNPRRFVSKVNDDNDTKALSYVSKSPKDMMFMLNKWEKDKALKSEFILQEFVPGIEIAIGGWFGRNGFADYWLENFEFKKLMNNDVGVNTGEMGTTMRYTPHSTLAEYFLRPLEGHLYRAGYTGYIDVAIMVGKDGTPYPLEFTTRPGWPLFEIQQSLHPEPVEWMANMLQGKNTFKPKEDIALGVVVAMPDFPFCNMKYADKCGYPLYGAEKIGKRNLHLSQAMMGEAPDDTLRMMPTIVSAGECVCTISGNGTTVSEAQEAAYKNVKKLELPNSPMYRTDIGDRLKDAIPTLTKFGWIKGWKF